MNVNKKIVVVISLKITLLLLFGAFLIHAEASTDADNGNITPSISSIVNFTGDKEQFKEDYLAVPGVMGGVSDFNSFKEYKNGDSVRLDGRAVAGSNDYLVNYNFKRAKVGELNVEFKQFRKYFDGTGGLHPNVSPPGYPVNFEETNRDLYLDIGDFKVDAVVAKDDMPKCAFSYERKYRTGTESLLAWTSVNPTTGGQQYKIFPQFRELDDITDRLSAKIEHSVQGFDVSVEQAWEKVHTQMHQNYGGLFTLSSGAFIGLSTKDDNVNSDAYTTTVRVSKECNEKVFVSADLLLNHYQGHTIQTLFSRSTTSNALTIYPENPANVKQDTVALLPKVSIQLLENLLMDAGVRWEWDYKDSLSNYNSYLASTGAFSIINIQSRTGENKIGENLGLKYDGIKNVRVYGDLEFEQQIRRQMEFQAAGGTASKNSNLGRDADVFYYDYNSKIGFKWYPMPKVDITTEFEHKFDIRDWANDSQTDVIGYLSTDGYRGFLDALWFKTYRPFILFNVKPAKWITYSFRYCLDTTYYGVRTPLAVDTEINKYIANTYTTSVTLTPRDSLYLTFYYQMRNAFTKTQANGDGGTPYNLPTFQANVNTLSTVCSYSPVKDSAIRGSYSLSRAENFNDYSSATAGFRLPLAKDNLMHNASLEFEQKVREYCTVSFRYNFMQYAEDSNNHMNDYIAHFLTASLKTKF